MPARLTTLLIFPALATALAAEEPPVTGRESDLPPLPRPVTSFGATRLGDAVYVYGGHTGDAHSYSKEEQADELWSLDLSADGPEWNTVAEGPHLQGNALVAAGGKVVLLGGFTAENAADEEQNLVSQTAVRAFDPATGEWSDLPPLPEPRSSFDAAVIGDTVYAVGGWSLQGEADADWHDTAWALNVSEPTPEWRPLADPPFKRRALATVAHGGKLYVLGGMQDEGGPTTAVSVYDPASDAWSDGPSLIGSPMNGFGVAGFSAGGRLYATAYDGSVQRLSADGFVWEPAGEMLKKRFFHRLIPTGRGVLVLGGGDMELGKYPDVDVLAVAD